MALTKIGTIRVHHYVNSSEYTHTEFTNNTPIDLSIGYQNRSTKSAVGFSPSTTKDNNTLQFAIIGGYGSNTDIVGITLTKKGYSMNVFYMNENYEFVNELLDYGNVGGVGTTIDIPVFSGTGSVGASSINMSTADPNTAIDVIVDGVTTYINNTPQTVNITNGNVVVNVSTHSPKDKYTVQINNGDNMLKLVDGYTQYTSFPASINVEANKTISAYGEPDKEITINYTNTGTPVVTNT